jgi:hypothetical protein
MAVFQIQNFKVERLLSVFSNQTDELVTEHPLASFDLPSFKQHFGVPEEDEDSEMVMEYDVQPKDIEFLSGYLSENVDYDFGKYAYFLSCHRVDAPEENALS